jgi:hypothetical protein
MTEERTLRVAVVAAVGAAHVAVAMIDNAVRYRCPVCEEVRAELVSRLTGGPQMRQQTCPRGVHRDWWADGKDLDCPWCEVDDLQVARVEAGQAS